MIDTPSAIFFNAHHSPIGAFASFTLGSKGACGGFGFEIGGPANEDVFIGVEDAVEAERYLALPFFSGAAVGADSQEFDVESLSGVTRESRFVPFDDGEVERAFGASIDTWRAGDLEVRIVSPVRSIPEPGVDEDDGMKDALAPAVLIELTLDNSKGTRERKAFFGYSGSNRNHAMQAWQEGDLVGIAQGPVSIATDDANAYSGVGFQPEAVLAPLDEANLSFMLGRVGLIVVRAAPGERRTVRFAAAFFREDNVTSGLRSRYLYRRFFESAAQVLTHALQNADDWIHQAEAFDRRLEGLTAERRIMLAQAIRSYYGSTQGLELEDGAPAWIVNEGEYRMMNTLDLMVDQAFFELEMNPWTVRNQLDLHRRRGLYRDAYGVAFTHDLGVANAFSERGRSAYEQAGLNGCFSFMSAEELVNWTLTASLYFVRTGDSQWLTARAGLLGECLESLIQRDDPRPDLRDGVMGHDSDRCAGGREITTYDSLDASLGQARGNLYLAVKTWAAYVLLGRMFNLLGERERAGAAVDQAMRCAATVAASADAEGVLPAVLGEAVPAKIIPAIEGLAFLMFANEWEVLRPDGPYASLLGALERHLKVVFSSGDCHFADGGWKLSSTSRNSWLSKIYLCQFVAERYFGLPPDRRADRAHLNWLMRPDNAYFAWSDQMLEGVAVGSRYYPRGVTAILWLSEGADTGGADRPSDSFAEVFP